MRDILLNEIFQPISDAGGEAKTVIDTACVLQDIKMEAMTAEGDLFYDEGYGWSLIEFQNALDDKLTVIEIKQRVSDKLKKREYIDNDSVSVSCKFENNTIKIEIAFSFTNGETAYLDIILNTYEIEVTLK